MHILITNDDGPPSPHSSPYVHCLVQHLQKAGHTVSVCLPHTQRSWIGKAHMIGQTLKPQYYRPSSTVHGEDSEGTTHSRPSPSGDVEEWVLIDGTPASCVQIGLGHFFQDRGPIDLVVSGPNYGRNTTALFALSSGTLGGALEAAVCGRKAIALSFAFFTRNHDPVIIEGACRHSVRVIDALYNQWPSNGSADLYSVNVPLVEGVEDHKTIWTDILQNYWNDGGCFEEIDGNDDGDGVLEEEKIREGPDGEVGDKDKTATPQQGHSHKHFKWAPKFAAVYKSVDDAGPGSDGWIVKEGQTSVTPLKANFASSAGALAQQEFKFPDRSVEQGAFPQKEIAVRGGRKDVVANPIHAIVSYEDAYVQPLILSALESIFPKDLIKLTTELPSPDGNSQLSTLLSSPDARAFQITSYETIDFEFAASHPQSYLINSYMIRKALIRKHYLSATLDHWAAKNPDSLLKKHVKRSEAFELDYAEFLDDALVEAFDLRESLDRNDGVEAEQRAWWILKPGMSDRGQGIRLFSTMDELQAIFDGWEAERPDSDDEEDEEDEDGEGRTVDRSAEDEGDYIMASHLRHFVAQPYIHPPLILQDDNRKFHIRTYVLCTGSLHVYVYKHMLALFAAKPYTAPWTAPDDTESFLTNTCLQGPSSPGNEDNNKNTAVRRFWSLPLPEETLANVFSQICKVTGEMFEAAARAMPIHFQTLPNAFEVFGLDFMVDATDEGAVWLLEVNAFPDFKQTGGDLEDIVGGFWKGVVRCGVAPFFGVDEGELNVEAGDVGDMVSVKEIDLGRR